MFFILFSIYFIEIKAPNRAIRLIWGNFYTFCSPNNFHISAKNHTFRVSFSLFVAILERKYMMKHYR